MTIGPATLEGLNTVAPWFSPLVSKFVFEGQELNDDKLQTLAKGVFFKRANGQAGLGGKLS